MCDDSDSISIGTITANAVFVAKTVSDVLRQSEELCFRDLVIGIVGIEVENCIVKCS